MGAKKSDKYYLITRPLQDSLNLAKEIENHGHKCFCEPLLNIEFFDDVTIDASQFSAILFTSANGIKALKKHSNFTDYLNLTTYCVGQSSGEYAKKIGFKDVKIAGGDVDKLAKLVRDNENSNSRLNNLLHISGFDAAGDLKRLIDNDNIKVERIILYKAHKSQSLSDELIKLLKAKQIKGVLLFSPRTAKIFCDLLVKYELMDLAIYLNIYCLSSNVAKNCDGIQFNDIKIADKPEAQILLDLIN